MGGPSTALLRGAAFAIHSLVASVVWSAVTSKLDSLARQVFRETDYYVDRMSLPDLERAQGDTPRFSRQSYRIDAPPQRVFRAYTEAEPAVLFPRTHLRFCRAYLPGSSEPTFDDDAWPGLVEGMRIFADLILRPLPWAIMVPVIVSRVDPTERVLQYDYLEGAITRGFNRVTLTPAPDDPDRTIIDHTCRFDGTTAVARATFPLFYDRYHVGFVERMHASVGAYAEALPPTAR